MQPPPEELVEQFAAGFGSVFIGAGLSMGAGLPSWEALVRPLATEVQGCPPGCSLLKLAQYYANEHGYHRLVARLRRELSTHHAEPSAAHDALVKLPIAHFFTTNLDDLLEAAFRRHNRAYTKIVTPADVPFLDDTGTSVIKLHGDLERPDSVVITAGQYADYFARHPSVARLLQNELQTRTVLFLGYSFSDIDLEMILARVASESRELRRNLFTVQFDTTTAARLELERQGLRVIGLSPVDGPDGVTRAMHDWLESLAARIRERSGRGVMPITLSVNNNLPPRVGDMLGREHDLTRVWDALGLRFPLVTIEGFAGIGKTRLATEIGHTLALPAGKLRPPVPMFDYVVWVSAKDRPDQKRWFDDVLNAVAETAGFPVIAQRQWPRREEKLKEVEKILRRNRGVILIIDNYETIDDPDLTAWIMRIPEPSKALVTTRDGQISRSAWPVHLQGLRDEEGIKLLRQHAAQLGLGFMNSVSDDTLAKLVWVTGGNPQAMKLSLGVVRFGAPRLWELIEQLAEANPTQSIDALFNELFSQAWERLTDRGKQVFAATAIFFGVNSIRRDALQAASGMAGHPIDFDAAIGRCIDLSLLEVHQELRPTRTQQARYTLHPMTRAFAGQKLGERSAYANEARERFRSWLMEMLRRSTARPMPSRRYWNALVSDRMDEIDPEWPSVQELLQWAEDRGKRELIIELVMLLVHYMDSRVHNTDRLKYVHRAVEALERDGRREDEALLRIDALGWTYVEEGQLGRAYDEIRRGLEIAEQLESSERDDLIALGYAWLARVRSEQDRHDDAREFIDRALTVNCSAWIRTRVNMAAGDLALKARDSQRALEHYEAAAEAVDGYGSEGHGYQIAPRIGLAYLSAGRLDEAERQFNELREFRHIEIGKLYADYGLAMVAYKRGEIVGARRILEEIKADLSTRAPSNLLMTLTTRLFEELEAESSHSGAYKIPRPLAE
jgi:tetratricopeptide (TPR) repeat protein